jgi:hypothetical protein
MCESMGPIVDRSEEHLVSSDVAVVRVRQLLLAAVKNFQAGASAPAVDSPELYREMTAGYITTPCGSQMMEAVAAMKLEPPETWSWLGPSRPVRAS